MRHAATPHRALRLTLAAVLAATALSFGAVPVAAQEKPDAETAKKMLGHIREAKALEKKSDWEGALAEYEKAYELSPQPALLYRMGKAAEEAGKLREAIDYYERFVEALPEENAARKVALELPKLKAKLPPELTITTTPPGANIYVGSLAGAPIGSTPYEGQFEAGKVTLLLKLDGYETHREELELEGADIKELNVTLTPLPTPEVSDGEEDGGGFPITTVGIVTTGIGVALLGTGGVFTVLKNGKVDEVNNYDKRADGVTPTQGRAEIEDLKGQAEQYYQTSLVTYIAGGVVTATGVALLSYGLLSAGDEEAEEASRERRPRFDFGVGRGGAWLGVRGSF